MELQLSIRHLFKLNRRTPLKQLRSSVWKKENIYLYQWTLVGSTVTWEKYEKEASKQANWAG